MTLTETRHYERDKKRRQRGAESLAYMGQRRCDYCGEHYQPRQRNQRFDTIRCKSRDRADQRVKQAQLQRALGKVVR